MDRLHWIVALVVVSLMLAACGDGGDAGTDDAAEAPDTAATEGDGGDTQAAGDCSLDEPVKVGVVFSQTGGAAVYGESQRAAVELAAEQQNEEGGVTYELIIEDDASDPSQGITAFEKLINQDQVSVIIGPTLSNTAFSTNPIAQDAGVPVLGVSNTAEGITEIGDYIWRNSLTEGQVIPQTIEQAAAAFGLENVAVLYGDDDSFTVSGYEVFQQALEDQGIDVATTQTFAKGDTDFAPQLTAARNENPDALVVSALAEEAALIIQQAAELGMDDIPIIGGNGFNSPAIIEQGGEAAEGVVVGAAWNSASDAPQTDEFIAAYEEATGEQPDQFAAQAYAGMNLVAMAVESQCSAERDAIREGFDGIEGVDTVLGEFSFTDSRDADHPAVVQIVEGGEFTILE